MYTISTEEYARRKAQGTIRLAQLGDAHVAIRKCFDPETGAEIAPSVVAISVDDLRKKRSELAADLSALDAMIADFSAAKKLDPGFVEAKK